MTEQTGKGRDAMTEAGIAYSAAVLLFAVVSFLFVAIASSSGEGYRESDWYRYLSFLLPQLCFAGTAVLFFRRNRGAVSPREVYCGCKPIYFLLAVLLAFGLMSLSELNEYFLRFLQWLGYEPQPAALPTVSGWYLIPALLVIALLPALFEETLFRGILVGNMRRCEWGTVPLVFISGALFSLFHCNPEQTIFQFICGVCYALLAVRSGSPFPTMAAHFANNAAILVMAACGAESVPDGAKLPVYLTAGICLAAVLVYLIFFDRKNFRRGGVKNGKKFFFTASAGIAIAAAEWIAVLITGFLHG